MKRCILAAYFLLAIFALRAGRAANPLEAVSKYAQAPEASAPFKVRVTHSSAVLTPPNSPSNSKESWESLIENDRLCEFLKLNPQPDPLKLFQSLLGKDSDLFRLTSEVLMQDLPDQGATSENLMFDFFRALKFAHLLDGTRYHLAKLRLDLANELLLKLQLRDPENGAYPYFRAWVFESLFPNRRDETRAILKEAFSAPKFDTFISKISAEGQRAGLRNAAYLLISTQYRSGHPVPRYQPVSLLISELVGAGDPGFDEEAIVFANRMIEPAQTANFDFENPNWVMPEWSAGASLGRRVWKKIYPELEVPAQFIPDPSRLQYSDASSEIYDLSSTPVCDRRAYDHELALLRSKLAF